MPILGEPDRLRCGVRRQSRFLDLQWREAPSTGSIRSGMNAIGSLPAGIDARARGLQPADAIFVFGTRLDAPAHLATELYHRGLAPLVVLTGGSARQHDDLVESHHHRDLLLSAGVPRSALVVEDKAANTYENVVFATSLLEDAGTKLSTVIAVVKRYHRRAIVTLAQHAPTIERIYAVDYMPPIRDDRVEREVQHMEELRTGGVDPLFADGNGWRRTR